MKQVVWLKVGMSHDGSLGGLLMQILSELDRVIGTSYSQDKLFSRASNEKMAVMLGIVFRNHGVGVLVIDEIQERNFQGHGRGEFSATFFLRLLNFGIPVVLIGNTFGIRALDTFSQDMRRIGSGGTIELHPLEEGDFDWENCLAPAIISLNLMPDISTLQNHKNLLFKYSGGIRDYAFRIQISSQRLALDIGQTALTEELINQAFLGSDFSERERALISGFRDKNPLILTQFEDIPWDDYAKKWGLTLVNGVLKNQAATSKSSKQADFSNANEQANPKPAKPVAQNELEKAKRNRTRKSNAAIKSAATKQTLESNDMRADGLKEVLIRGMESAIRGGSL